MDHAFYHSVRHNRAMRFADLRSAGRLLAAELQRYRNAPDTMVLGIARGGVPAAVEIAKDLALPLDLVLLRALLQRRDVHDPVRAVSVAGTLILDDELAERDPRSRTAEDLFIADALEAFARRESCCRGHRGPISLTGKTVLLVDNAIRSGSTIRGAMRALRKMTPNRVIVTVPVSSTEGLDIAKALADGVICLATPEPFGNGAMWYERFDVPRDEEIESLLP
jgi:putative phosphoribosyl transferase